MSRKRKASSLMDSCRLCLSKEGAMINLFDESLRKQIENLASSTDVQIKNDDRLPGRVCHICLYKLDMWSEFKQRFIESNETLIMHLEASEHSDYTTQALKIKKGNEDQDDKYDLTKDSMSLSQDLNESMELDDHSKVQNDDYSSSKDSSKRSQENGLKSPSLNKSSNLIKRSKVTERRKASTKRWVARKKALLAATGENASDSDSANTDDAQLSPVQKARAKTNADKEAERQRRIAKALKHLETDMVAETIIPADPDSRRTRAKNSQTRFTDSSKGEENFTPQSVRAELEVGDTTYIVTSTLFFVDTQNGSTNKTNTIAKSGIVSGEDNAEENTDIFDAVQLRRINPKIPPAKENSYLERCLNIEVEGSGLEQLQQAQQELAIFVEKEMKNKMTGMESPIASRRSRNKDPLFARLDSQLKTIVEKAIRKNYEASQNSDSQSLSGGGNVISPAFMEAAMRSKIFQPQVVVERMDIDEAKKLYTINNLNVEKLNNLVEPAPVNVFSRKRQITAPLKFQDYDISDKFGMGIELKDEDLKKPIKKAGPLSATIRTESIETKSEKPMQKVTVKMEVKKHMCAFCNKMFDNRSDIENHVKTHKISSTNQTNTEKVRKMRCKRCHEIVEARLVKMHKCQNNGAFKCTTCNSAFKTDQLLKAHMETHASSKPNVKLEKENKPVIIQQTLQNIAVSKPEASKPEIESKSLDTATMCFLCDKKFTDQEMLKDHLQKHCDEISEEDERLSKEDYQCAICCKSLESEDALEIHVEKHLYDEEDDNPNLISIDTIEIEKKAKENIKKFSCLECGKVYDSELLLIMHQPLHEEEAEIAEWEKSREDVTIYECDICEATFSSELELGEHVYSHEGAHVCLLCEQQFESLEQLQKHVATH